MSSFKIKNNKKWKISKYNFYFNYYLKSLNKTHIDIYISYKKYILYQNYKKSYFKNYL